MKGAVAVRAAINGSDIKHDDSTLSLNPKKEKEKNHQWLTCRDPGAMLVRFCMSNEQWHQTWW